MAKLADTMLGYSCCHNSSYLASEVKEDKVLLWAYNKLPHIMSLVHKEEGREERLPFFSGQPHCDSKWRCLLKDVKTVSDWQVMKTTNGDGEEAQDSWKKCNSNFGKERWGKPEKRRAKSLGKQTVPLSPKGTTDLNCNFVGSNKSEEGQLCSQWTVCHRLVALENQVFMSVVRRHMPLHLLSLWVHPHYRGKGFTFGWNTCISFFFLQKEAREPALPHRWFPIKIINNNVGTLFLERRFVSVPKWAKRGKISCCTLRKK